MSAIVRSPAPARRAASRASSRAGASRSGSNQTPAQAHAFRTTAFPSLDAAIPTGAAMVAAGYAGGRPSFSVRAVSGSAPVASSRELDEKFGLGDDVVVNKGNGDQTRVILNGADGGQLEVYLFGACVTSWRLPTGQDMLFVRPDAKFDKSKAISGGIPICWPQFGPGNLPQGPKDLPQHGFARDSEWELVETKRYLCKEEGEVVKAVLRLLDTEATRAVWPKEFEVLYELRLLTRGKLATEFKITNKGGEAFDFTGALHSYFSVKDALSPAVSVTGMGMQWCMDRANAADPDVPNVVWEGRDKVEFGPDQMDSIYVGTAKTNPAFIARGDGSGLVVTTQGWNDYVLWNPGETMPDCNRNFICVEAAAAATAPVVPPGGTWVGGMQLEYEEEVSKLDWEKDIVNFWDFPLPTAPNE